MNQALSQLVIVDWVFTYNASIDYNSTDFTFIGCTFMGCTFMGCTRALK